MAALLGQGPPVNSQALLPWQLLAPDMELRAMATWAAARQLLAAHDKQEEGVRRKSVR